MNYTREFPQVYNFVTRRWTKIGAETCRQLKLIKSHKYSYLVLF